MFGGVTKIALDEIDLGSGYRAARERVSQIVLEAGADDTPVPACPGWTVRDVLAHLASIPEDVAAGKLAGPPDDDFTAAQVARWEGVPTDKMITAWAAASPDLEALIREVKVWPPYLDVLAHEHDILGALGRAERRDSEDVMNAGTCLIGSFHPAVPMVANLEGEAFDLGPTGSDLAPVVLHSTYFETFRFRLGRRSRRQLAAMEWSGDPAPFVETLTIFGPAPLDIEE
jgi:uncharacterized protein (TIGR03083 family)